MKQIQGDNELYSLHSAGVGMIYNDFSRHGSSGYKFNVLHSASCNWILRSNVNISKIYFETLPEARAWLESNRGPEGTNWKVCGTCLAKNKVEQISSISNKPIPARNIAQATNTLRQQAFTEALVENALISWLESRGYVATKRVRMNRGIIDVMASGPDGRWIIEAKGEDRGGYASAEMNFQMGVGQIVSRMSEPDTSYALAIPLTYDFRRVLGKFKGTTGFVKLGLTLFIVEENGTIRRIAPADIAEFLQTL